VGRRNAGVKFYRLILIIAAALFAAAAGAHVLAGRRDLAAADGAALAAIAVLYLVLRFPKRWIYRLATALLWAAALFATTAAYHAAIRPSHVVWSAAGAATAILLLGSVNLAMLLGHWYLVVRGMAIEPLKRLTVALLAATVLRLLLVAAVLASLAGDGFEYGSPLYRVAVAQGIFFWMRVGWGLLGPIVLWPMIWGTVRIRSTMAATGILYVAVVAVVIGEVLSTYLSALERFPL
jgi:hypothetical protein